MRDKARSTIGEFAVYVEQLRARNAELEPIARRAKSLQTTVDDMAREIVELRAALKRRAERPGPRRRNAGGADHRGDRASSSEASAGR